MRPGAILREGETCWRRLQAERVSLLIDASAYYAALADVFPRARSSIIVVGWDLHSRTQLRPGEAEEQDLASILRQCAEAQPHLHIQALGWDFAPLLMLEREFMPVASFGRRAGSRVAFALDSNHPIGGSHHQKLVVLDDVLAFLGGIDITVARWDEDDHRPDNPLRRRPGGEPYGPFHDLQLAVTGEPARVLGDWARRRWTIATGEPCADPIGAGDPLWPRDIEPDFYDIEMGLARTWPEPPGPEVREVERLFLEEIAAARKSIYIENQYLTGVRIRDAIAARLREPDGPEVVIMTPRQQSGRLERNTLGTLRSHWVGALRAADRYNRLRVLAPQRGDKTPINVHSKAMFVDDAWLHVGSANLSNRSMGLDSELDAVLLPTSEAQREALVAMRDRLLAHLAGVPRELVQGWREQGKSLVEIVDGIQEHYGTLPPLAVEPNPEPLPLAEVIDPDRPMDEALAERLLPANMGQDSRGRWWRKWLGLAVAVGLAALAGWWSLRDAASPGALLAAVRPWAQHELAPVVSVLLFVVASLLMVPVTALIVVMVVLFGPWVGFFGSLVGSLLSAMAAYGVGRYLWHGSEMFGRRLTRVSKALAERGVTSVAVVRVLPVAPFTLVNLVAGSSHIRFRDFVLGTFAGMTPGLVVMAMASDRVMQAVRHPDLESIAAALGGVIVMVGAIGGIRALVRRYTKKQQTSES